ncbi:universal stress protein [Streptomyces sp. ISL-22]|uniref:universal stress protein n=1 Tax=unclassified Streptomyces TaxID=2593676 RepID=UPI001BEB9DAE|nr:MULTISPECIES: universal stress protein [unclassified Streptomyces]MBT2420167.1 universal stress protein [Streptomyces sp. ISL-24]MBT2433219.1 universal stress protein [Streptomyces sp. ISL-22]
MTGPVVVGLDGSPASMTAAWWAAHEAADQRLPVELLYSWTTQPLDVPVRQEADIRQRHGRDVLRRTAAELLRRRGELRLTTELVSAPAAQALLERGAKASMLVLGSRGYGSVASFLLGSISLHVLGLAPCPAIAVRAGDPAVEAGWNHPAAADRDEVVVGLAECGAAADPLLEFAFAVAAPRGWRVRAVRALPLSALAPVRDEDAEAEERVRLAQALAPWRERFPGVPVTGHVATGPAAQVLLTASARGCLTVVGRRRHPSRLTWKLGPVSHAALHHVPCPIAVVPHD